MKKIIMSLVTISALVAVGAFATTAFFSDEEKSEGNTFQAGAIDLQVDSQQHYNNAVCVNGVWQLESNATATVPQYPVLGTSCGGTWDSKDLTEEKFFNFSDVKPGDKGENTISLTGSSNPYWACVTINPTFNDDMSSTEPELKEVGETPDGDSIWDGELAQNMIFTIWADSNGNNIQDGDEPTLTTGKGPITPRSWALADSTIPGGPWAPDVTHYLGVKWEVPGTVGNIIQTDKYMADISFYVEQARNNEGFKCPVVEPGTAPATQTLRLENETQVADGPWTVVVDNKFVDMTYNTSGPTFDYTLVGQGLAPSTQYSLIYYADGWPGNNPGALIGTHSTDVSGAINVPLQNAELNMDLPTTPDTNLLVGAKIWLIPSDAYNSGTNSVIVWPPNFDTWFFEGNVYINYNDTQV